MTAQVLFTSIQTHTKLRKLAVDSNAEYDVLTAAKTNSLCFVRDIKLT